MSPAAPSADATDIASVMIGNPVASRASAR